MSLDNHRSVLLDDRENKLYDAIVLRHPDLQISRTRLTTGDVHIIRGTTVALVLERKSRADLRASLLDGRFHSQRSRMVTEFGKDHVAFVVEGGSDWSEAESGAETALVMRDRIPVLWTMNTNDTADLISRLSKTELLRREEPPSGENTVRAAAASTGCPLRSLAAMLRCVPGVSARRASAIAAQFGSMSELASAIATDEASARARIADCRPENGGSRFGPALAHRVVTCISGCRSIQ